jgi:hypothetical protein
MEQAQFGVLEMDWLIASLQAVDQSPWRAFTRPPGAHMTITQHGIVASSRDFLDKQRLADYFMSFVRSWTAGPAICERWPSRLVATAAEVFGVIETALRSHFAKEIPA